MLAELNKILGPGEGLMFVEHEVYGEPSLLTMHYVSEFSKQKANVVVISLMQSEEMFRTVCGKLAIRLDPKLFRFISWRQILAAGDDVSVATLEQTVLNSLDQNNKTLIVFDNATAFTTLNSDMIEPFLTCQRIRRHLTSDSLVILASSNPLHFQGFEDIATAHFKLELVNKGCGKNVTGVLRIEHHSTPVDASIQEHIYHYLLGERSFKLFLPGATQLLI